ncbi:unnamed protein product [Penicillium manginii]
MGAIPEHDPEEPVETKPFKFVTVQWLIDLQLVRIPSIILRRDRFSGYLRDTFGQVWPDRLRDWRLTIFGAIIGYDARFPQQNQTKHCWQNYVDYYKCVEAKGDDFRPCKQFYHAFRSLCPKAWTDRWDGQREGGNFPAILDK